MDKKIMKLIYKLRKEKKSQRQIKKFLEEKYNIYLKQKVINDFLIKIPYSRDKYSKKEKEMILYLYKKIPKTQNVIDYLNKKYKYKLTLISIRCLASEHKVQKKIRENYAQSFINRSDEFKIMELYKQGLTGMQIAELFGYKTKKSIYDKLERVNCSRRNWNEIQSDMKTYSNFSMRFVDTAFKAYFLGLIITDGYVNNKRKYIGIDLCDLDVIEFIKNNIGCKYNIIKYKKKKHYKTKYRIILYGEKLINEFNRLGVFAKKTFTAVGPKLYTSEKRYLSYIIRGIIDGDGWIRKDGKEFFISSASEELINWCLNSLRNLGFENIKVNFKKNEYKGIYLIRSGVKDNIEILKNVIYKEDFGMKRKYDLLL